jgi:hypothetical protein
MRVNFWLTSAFVEGQKKEKKGEKDNKGQERMPEHYVYENDNGSWSLVDNQMETYLNQSSRNFLVDGFNSAEVYPSFVNPSHGITSHLEHGMSGYQLWFQYNLSTQRCRVLSRIRWETDLERDQILKDGSMIPRWKSVGLSWNDCDRYFSQYLQHPHVALQKKDMT